MKQLQLSQFDPARLLTHVLSRLVDAHAIEHVARKTGHETGVERTGVRRSTTSAAEEILKTAERGWPSRYY